MPDYIRLIGEFFFDPPVNAHVPDGLDTTNYNNIIWEDTPIPQATLDALDDNELTLFQEVLLQRFQELTVGDIIRWDGAQFVPERFKGTGGGSLDRYADIFEFGSSVQVKNKFLESAINQHTSVNSTVIALANGRIVHVTISTGKMPGNNWFAQIITGATTGGGQPLQTAMAATTADLSGTYSTSGQSTGKFTSVDLTNIDGISVEIDEIILVKDEIDAKQNGVYVVTTEGASGKLERAGIVEDDDADGGFLVEVDQGTVHGGEIWELQGGQDQVLNTDDLNWAIYTGPPISPSQFSGGFQIGTDLEKPAGTLDKVFTNLTGFEFVAGDRIAIYIKQGTQGLTEGEQPVIRLFAQYD